jgi:hypothetical protein
MKSLWATLQSDFEKVVKRKDDLKEVLAAVVGDNSDLATFRETLLKMQGLRTVEVWYASFLSAHCTELLMTGVLSAATIVRLAPGSDHPEEEANSLLCHMAHLLRRWF